MKLQIRRERPEEERAVEELTRDAFWDVYCPGCVEHLIVHRLRRSPALVRELNLVALADGKLAGHIMSSRGTVTDGQGIPHGVLLFGPVSVRPEYQGRGIGGALIRRTLKEGARLSFPGVVICGNPAYYRRFGFSGAARFGITDGGGESPEALQALELRPGGLAEITGRFQEDEAYRVTREQAEVFDRGFEPRETHVTDTRLTEE